ncbi:hypothetical protein [Bradyrhizobium sp. STM 3809]|uniref:hypothetical protein n=1 Tax=Bradyrhizobium sp. STM 3809 TaxID=551936 RepID=UPI001111E908|nr:hypothetical protein [Bradyrhizobium sp. STM 3809]
MSNNPRFAILPARQGSENMSEWTTQPDKLRADAAECAVIRDLATDRDKRELFARLAEHLSTLAAEVEAHRAR